MRYADRIYNLAVTDPRVNALDPDEVEEYARQKARELCIDEDKVARRVSMIQPSTTDFKKASEFAVETEDLIQSQPNY